VTPAEAIDRGRAAYAAGRPAEALDDFRLAMRLAPRNPVPAYDAAAALFQLGQFADARALYQAARALAGPALRTGTDFALGNTALALRDFASAIRHYDECIASTAPGTDLDRIRLDAAINRRFAEEHSSRNNEPSPPEPPDKGQDARGQPSADSQNHSGQGAGAGQPDPAPGSSPGHRGAGGAGGSGVAPPRAGSPEAQLSEALDNVRQARRRRIEEANTSHEPENRKDW
jgi:Ca-activated chloride channel family protein